MAGRWSLQKLLGAALVLLFTASCGPVAELARIASTGGAPAENTVPGDVEPGWVLHENQDQGFALTLPKTWRRVDIEDDALDRVLEPLRERAPDIALQLIGRASNRRACGVYFAAFDAAPDAISGAIATTAVVAKTAMPADVPLSQISQWAVDQLDRSPGVVKPVYRRRMATPAGLAEQVWYRAEGTSPYSMKPVNVATTQYLILAGVDLYQLRLDTLGRKADQYGSVFDRIAGSFRIIANKGHVRLATTPRASYAPDVQVLYEDNFCDDSSGFQKSSASSGTSLKGYGVGEYFMKLLTAPGASSGTSSWSAAFNEEQRFGDFSLEADARMLEDAVNGSYSLLFRLQDPDNYYQFWVEPFTGDFRVSKLVGKRPIGLVGWTESAAINPDLATNRLRVVAQGTALSVFVNDKHLTTVEDTSFSDGMIGMMINAFDEPIAAGFSKLLVTKPPAVSR